MLKRRKFPRDGMAVPGVGDLASQREAVHIGMLLSYTRSHAWSGEKYCKAMVTLTWEVYVAA